MGIFGSKHHGRNSDLFIFVDKISPFSYFKKSQETWSRESLQNFQKT